MGYINSFLEILLLFLLTFLLAGETHTATSTISF